MLFQTLIYKIVYFQIKNRYNHQLEKILSTREGVKFFKTYYVLHFILKWNIFETTFKETFVQLCCIYQKKKQTLKWIWNHLFLFISKRQKLFLVEVGSVSSFICSGISSLLSLLLLANAPRCLKIKLIVVYIDWVYALVAIKRYLVLILFIDRPLIFVSLSRERKV